MPVQSTLGALTYPKGTFFETTTGNGWISLGKTGLPYWNGNASFGVGTGIAVDSGGNVFVPTTEGINTNGGYTNKFDSTTGNNVWRTSTNRGPGVAAGTSNIFITENFARTVSGVPTYSVQSIGLTNSNLTPVESTINITGNMTNNFNFPEFYGVRQVNGNIVSFWKFGSPEIGRFYQTDANNSYKKSGTINSTLGGTSFYQPNDFCFDPSGNNMFTIGYVYNSGNITMVVSQFSKSGNNYVNGWHRAIGNISYNSNSVFSIAADDSHVFVSTTVGIAKLTNTGNLVAQKGPHGARINKLCTDNTGNVYALYSASFQKFDSNLDMIYNNYFLYNIPPTGNGGPIGIQANSTHVFASSVNRDVMITYKVPADGSIPGSGIYRIGPYIVRYLSSNLTQTNTFATFSNTTIVSGNISGTANVAPTVSSTTLSPSNVFSQTQI